MDSPWRHQKSFVEEVALAWTLETKKTVGGERMGKGHPRLREAGGADSGDAFYGCPTGDKEQMTRGKGRRGAEARLEEA